MCAAPAAPNAHARAPPRLVDLSSPRIFLDPIRVVLSVSQLRFLTTHSSPSTPSDYKFELTAAFQKALDDQEAAGSSPLRPSTRQHHTTIDDQYNRIYVTTPSTTPSPTGGGKGGFVIEFGGVCYQDTYPDVSCVYPAGYTYPDVS